MGWQDDPPAKSGGGWLNDPPASEPQTTVPKAPTTPVQPQQVPSWLSSSMTPGQVSTAAAPTQTAAPPQTDAPIAWSDVPGMAAQNLGPSAYQFGSDIVQAVAHPIDTATNLYGVGHGAAQKAGLASGEEDIGKADAVGQFFANRYGSMEGFKKALATDPVGVAGDLSTVLSGGGSAAARLPGLAGKVGSIAAKAGRLTDPLALPAKAAGYATELASKVASPLLSIPTGTGARSLDRAFVAGREGGDASEALTSQMRGGAQPEAIVDHANSAIDRMRDNAQAAYRQNKAALAADKRVMPWNDVDRAINNVDRAFTFKGRAASTVTDTIDAVKAKVADWKSLHPGDYHTPEGFDALKKELWGDVIAKIPPTATDAKAAAMKVYDAVKDTVVQHAPGYSDMLGNYQGFQARLNELTRELSLGKNVDTALRKLTSSVRNNASTNFGRRENLITQLEKSGAPQLKNMIAGSDLNTILPRGIVGRMLGGLGGLTTAGGLASLGTAAMTAPFFSPRAMGEAFHGLGSLQRLGNAARPAISSLHAPGRIYVSPNREAP